MAGIIVTSYHLAVRQWLLCATAIFACACPVDGQILSPLPPDQSESSTNAQVARLPHYQLDIELHPQQRRVKVQQATRWTNHGTRATSELVFQVTANNKLSDEMIDLGERTVE